MYNNCQRVLNLILAVLIVANIREHLKQFYIRNMRILVLCSTWHVRTLDEAKELKDPATDETSISCELKSIRRSYTTADLRALSLSPCCFAVVWCYRGVCLEPWRITDSVERRGLTMS